VIGFQGVGISVDSTFANLSGGERQGIAIGRAMHCNADLIVLDKPTAALIGAVDAEIHTIILHYLLSSEYF
jgi:ABC-type dipeptide/oligopeptide/nickel transport system ATPase subunit